MRYTVFILLLFSGLVNHELLWSQNVVGAEIEKRYYHAGDRLLSVRVQVCRFETSKEYVLFDWGDGQSDTILLSNVLDAGNGYVFNNYYAEHIYDADTAKYVNLKAYTGTIMDGFKNVNYTLNTDVVLEDSFYVYNAIDSPILGLITYEGLILEYTDPSSYSGVDWLKNISMYQPLPAVDVLVYSLDTFPVAGYSASAPEDELYIEEAVMYWNHPVEPSKYAVAGKVRELRPTNNPIYEESTILLSTITKAFTILVDSANIVSTLPAIDIDAVISTYPNPATTEFTLEYSGLSGEVQLQVLDVQGRLLLQKELIGTAAVQRETLDVSTWPSGVYWLELNSAEGRVTKKVVVE